MNSDSGPTTSARRSLWPLLKWALFVIVLVFVIQHGYQLWTDAKAQQAESTGVRIRAGWLLASVGLCVLGWAPSVWYWRKLMSSLGEHVSWKHAARAYFCGHLGKYVPGKAAVIVIRTAMLRSEGVRTATAALTVTYETLAYMSSGLMTIAALLPWWADEHGITKHLPTTFSGRAVWAVPAFLTCFLGWIVFSQFFFQLVRRLAKVSDRDPRSASETATPAADAEMKADLPSKLSLRVCLSGIVPLAGGWLLSGLSLGCSVRAVSDAPVSLSHVAVWTVAVATANILGFVAVFAPGGVGVREGLLMRLLTPHIGPLPAVLVALIARGVAFASELLPAAALYYAVRPTGRGTSDDGRTAKSPRPGTT
jgi:uncharacterized membrane protein YbhN (UPF0104 family)